MQGTEGVKDMYAPRFKWEWNINTVTQLVSLALILISSGIIYSELRAEDARSREHIERLDRRMTDLEHAFRKLDRHELQITNIESQIASSALAARAVEQSLATLSADIRVVREILQRLETQQKH